MPPGGWIWWQKLKNPISYVLKVNPNNQRHICNESQVYEIMQVSSLQQEMPISDSCLVRSYWDGKLSAHPVFPLNTHHISTASPLLGDTAQFPLLKLSLNQWAGAASAFNNRGKSVVCWHNNAHARKCKSRTEWMKDCPWGACVGSEW